ncbi:ubiquitin-like-specific protease [Acrasis kona]|uniref:Ubiquitin-like-specific protease n=1 Tax=Acrasis kona TaxID=1008807 RepID=A0AAW2ZCB9_9EUKA
MNIVRKRRTQRVVVCSMIATCQVVAKAIDDIQDEEDDSDDNIEVSETSWKRRKVIHSDSDSSEIDCVIPSERRKKILTPKSPTKILRKVKDRGSPDAKKEEKKEQNKKEDKEEKKETKEQEPEFISVDSDDETLNSQTSVSTSTFEYKKTLNFSDGIMSCGDQLYSYKNFSVIENCISCMLVINEETRVVEIVFSSILQPWVCLMPEKESFGFKLSTNIRGLDQDSYEANSEVVFIPIVIDQDSSCQFHYTVKLNTVATDATNPPFLHDYEQQSLTDLHKRKIYISLMKEMDMTTASPQKIDFSTVSTTLPTNEEQIISEYNEVQDNSGSDFDFEYDYELDQYSFREHNTRSSTRSNTLENRDRNSKTSRRVNQVDDYIYTKDDDTDEDYKDPYEKPKIQKEEQKESVEQERIENVEQEKSEDVEQEKPLEPKVELVPKHAKEIVFAHYKNIVITEGDLKRTNESEFLNDNLIDFYLDTLQERLKNITFKKIPNVYIFKTTFFPLLRSKDSRVRSSKRTPSLDVKLFEKDFVFLPINNGRAHWMLLVLCYPSDPERMKLMCCDSLGKRPSQMKYAKEYFQLRYLQENPDKEGIKLSGCHATLPVQDNNCDCGVYLLEYVEKMMLEPPESIPIKNENWFDSNVTSKKRQDLRSQICSLHAEQRVPKPSI